MKFVLALFAILAVTGLSQTHQFPDFGKGPLHEDLQDILDLVPLEKIIKITFDYMHNDPEVKRAIDFLSTSGTMEDLVEQIKVIPERIKFLNYLRSKGVGIAYQHIVNTLISLNGEINQTSPYIMKRTGGIAGLVRDIKKQFHYDEYITIYVKKMKSSSAFRDFIKQLKSNNFQQLVNKVYRLKPFQTILNMLKKSGLHTRIVADIMYIVLGINVPENTNDTLYEDKQLIAELLDFVALVPADEFNDILVKYLNEDKQVMAAMKYATTTEFHDMLRAVEALKEYQAFVIYLQETGLSIFETMQSLHMLIGMEDFVPPTVKSMFASENGLQSQKEGAGIRGMVDEFLAILQLDKIEALYKEKLRTSKVFADFIAKISSPELQKIFDSLRTNKIFLNMIGTAKTAGLDLEAFGELLLKIFGLKFPSS